MIHKHNGLLLSQKKGWNIVICDNMDGTKDHCIKWNKPRTTWSKFYMESKKNVDLTEVEDRKVVTRG
jgi:hypothetical protein